MTSRELVLRSVRNAGNAGLHTNSTMSISFFDILDLDASMTLFITEFPFRWRPYL